VLLRTEFAVGQNKAKSLARGCRHYFPDTLWSAADTEIAGTGFERIAPSDIIFSCVDDEIARLEIAYIGTKFDVPVCDAGLGGENYSAARVSFFPGRHAASFCCMLPPARRRELLTLWDCRSFGCWAEANGETAWPGTPTAAAMAGSMQVETGLRLLLESRHGAWPAAQSIEFTLDPPGLTSFRIPMSPGCPFHEEMSEDCILRAAASDLTVGELLRLAGRGCSGDPVLLLDWPLCVYAKCRACSYQWSPMKRLALFRRSAACPACLSRQIFPVRTVHRLGRDSDLAGYRLRELGMPDRHLYTIEFETGAAP
jgi:adenylyltransferase/sulfurtransferase